MQESNLNKIYEDENVLVINKLVGLVVHRDRKGNPQGEKTLADLLLAEYPQINEVGEPLSDEEGQTIIRPGIVHRLDKDTSGIMIIAKNQKTFEFLKEQFKSHQIEKTYQAIIYGIPKKDFDEIDLPIGRSRKDPRMRMAGKGATGKLREAKTKYKVLEKFKGYCLVEAKPLTGRTHQIRVHFKTIGHAVVGDRLYATNLAKLPGLDRQALHAYSLAVNLPNIGLKTFLAELPKDMKIALDYLKML